MKKLAQLIFSMLLMIITQHVYGEIPSIDSLKIIPENPLVGDEVKVIIYTTFPSGSCNLATHSVDIQDGEIQLDLVYNVGFFTYICHSIDTISIGFLEPRDYEMEVNLNVEWGLDGQQTLEDTEILLFSVSGQLGVSMSDPNSGVLIYPNPFHNRLSIVSGSGIEKVEIFSVVGEKLVVYLSNINDTSIDLSDLSPGTYFLKLIHENGECHSQKISKTGY